MGQRQPSDANDSTLEQFPKNAQAISIAKGANGEYRLDVPLAIDSLEDETFLWIKLLIGEFGGIHP